MTYQAIENQGIFMDTIKITFIQPSGEEQSFAIADLKQSLMNVARAQGVAGIPADCGGACACATCHVYVEPDWISVVGRATGVEAEMLDLTTDESDFKDSSRLSCQIDLRPELDGLRVHVAAKS